MRGRWSRILGVQKSLTTRLSAANGNRGPEAKKIKGEKAGKLISHENRVLNRLCFRLGLVYRKSGEPSSGQRIFNTDYTEGTD